MQQRSTGQAGFTLIEVIVAGTLLAMLVVGVSTASSITGSMIAEYKARTGALTDLNVLRARLIADATAHTRAFCNGSKLVFRKQGGGPPVLAEYRVDQGKLMRWYSPADNEYAVVDRADSLTCTDLGTDSVEIDIALGATQAPTHLYLIVAPAEG